MSNNKKYWYLTENEAAADLLKERSIFHVWGGVTGTESATHPGVPKYLLCVDWTGRDMQEKIDFEAHEHVTSLPHPRSRKPVDPQTIALLKDCTKASGQHAISEGDHTHDIVEKLTGHTGWHGWWRHL
jgi:hypothetical protein